MYIAIKLEKERKKKGKVSIASCWLIKRNKAEKGERGKDPKGKNKLFLQKYV